MSNPCGTTRANILRQSEINGIPLYFGTGVNPVNSPAQFFVAWGETVKKGLIHTFNREELHEGCLWFIDEDEAERKFLAQEEALKEIL
ncbi:hypothetical protein [Desulfitobacterium chlororespirans]|uniref:Uncharacterized protein n=1 Tax=Desulfitobacterium chlororespirans DSM 11544 TaxID=1121395 RepID=A0A1M7TBS6_9FIRM|nr:hypothetical protein [Desulfitobacterium chlororespirans]SHN68180.1 hypothetical protein SAMN02745215_01747 [Desulfitobacterium chlororespirans DSM 11544]